MKTMNVSEFKSALQRAADIKGEAGMIAQKKLILEGYMITDENGLAVDPSTLDVVVRPAAPAEEMETDMKEELEEKVASAVRKSLASQIADTKFSVAASPKEWENAKTWGRLKHLKSKETAYRFGSWCLAAMGHRKSADFCAKNGLVLTKGHQEGVNTQGGFLVPDLMENELITLREQYGVFRRNARVFPMQGDTLRIPKRLSGLTAYFVGETAAGTESTQTFDSVQLVAKKLMALTTVSNELLEDAVVAIGDDIAGEIAYQFAFKEDDAGFNGTGTSSYGGIVGLVTALTDSTYQVSTTAVTTKATVAVADVSAAFAKLPAWASQRSNIKIFTNKGTYHAIFERLAMVAGGVTAAEIGAGLSEPRFFGYPVEFSQAIAVPSDSDGQVIGYIGDLAQACYFGDKRQTSIAFSDSALNAFEQDERVVRGSQRFDIVCANVGSSSASGAIVKFTI